MEHIIPILSVSGTALGFCITAITFIAKFIKSAKQKRLCEQTTQLSNAIIPFIQQAETFINYTAIEKKEFVMTKANQFAIENKIPFNLGLVDGKIEELVALTKQVNMRNKFYN